VLKTTFFGKNKKISLILCEIQQWLNLYLLAVMACNNIYLFFSDIIFYVFIQLKNAVFLIKKMAANLLIF